LLAQFVESFRQMNVNRGLVWGFDCVPSFFGPLQANKKHSFHEWRGKERREALSISGAKRSPEKRGSEHGALLVFAPRRAAQAGLTGGADRSGRLRRETNVRTEDQPKAEPLTLRVENSVFSGHCLQQPGK